MISTVTTTTVTTIVTLTSGASLGAIATMLLVTLLGTKEVAMNDAPGKKQKAISFLNKKLNVAVLPLLFTVALVMTLKAMEFV